MASMEVLSVGLFTKDDVYNLIDDAVRIREEADVEIATHECGGVDSSIITGQW